MAKQNVSFIERHVEKVVIGVAGAALLAIAALYLISTPNKVEMNGDKLGPEKFYATLQEKAEQARNRMRNARPEQDVPGEGMAIEVMDSDAQRSPYDDLNLPKEFAQAFAPIGPTVPEVGMGPARGQVLLADILPPKPVLVTSGQAFAKLPEPETIVPGSSGDGSSEAQTLGVTRDYHWVTVVAAVHRKKQREKFDKAGYELNRQRLIVAGIEAQRQQLLLDGEWSEPVLVIGYAPRVIPVLRSVELFKQNDGTHVIYESDSKYIADYRKLLETSQGQADVLRPSFQEFLEYPYDWELPAQLPDLDIDLADYDVLLPPDEESGVAGRRARRDTTGRSTYGSDTDRSGRALISKLFKDADEAIEKGEYVEAGEMLNQIIDSTDAPATKIEEAQSKLRSIQPKIDQALIAKRREEERLAQVAEQQLGEDVEPIWLNDMNVTPGATYRYRLRLLAYNPYVGVAFKLKQPEDAGKVVTEGQWSDWSEPIQVAPAIHLFLASVDGRAKEAKLEMREWNLGDWHVGSKKISVGDAIAFSSGRHHFTYNAIVADVVEDVSYQERLVSRGGEISYHQKPTAAVVLINSSGGIEEHMAAIDSRLKREFTKKIKDYEKKRSQFSGKDLRRSRKLTPPVSPVRQPAGDKHLEGPDDLLLR